MKKPSPTQRKIIEGRRPSGMSQAGGWSSALLVCRKNGWIDENGDATDAGRTAIAPTPETISRSQNVSTAMQHPNIKQPKSEQIATINPTPTPKAEGALPINMEDRDDS